MFASAVATEASLEAALDAVAGECRDRLGPSADLGVVFFSGGWVGQAERLVAGLRRRLEFGALIGCSAESVAGRGCEVETQTAISLWAARLPQVRVHPMHLRFQRTAEGPTVVGWPDSLATEWAQGSVLLGMGEPFTFPADYLLERLNADRPGVPVVGGMASGGSQPGEHRLVLGDQVLLDGGVFWLLEGLPPTRTVVSQGCRPIGEPLVVTRAERNEIFELGGRPALEPLQQVFEALPNCERELVRQGLFLGRVVNEYQDRFEAGDFLIRSVLGIDPQRGTVQVGDYLRAGQTVQFHLRDQQTASADLRDLLQAAVADGQRVDSVLMFTCNGRGTRMFDQPHHDAGLVARTLDDPPLAGFFAQGEMGPVGGRNFLHGFTASLLLMLREGSANLHHGID